MAGPVLNNHRRFPSNLFIASTFELWSFVQGIKNYVFLLWLRDGNLFGICLLRMTSTNSMTSSSYFVTYVIHVQGVTALNSKTLTEPRKQFHLTLTGMLSCSTTVFCTCMLSLGQTEFLRLRTNGSIPSHHFRCHPLISQRRKTTLRFISWLTPFSWLRPLLLAVDWSNRSVTSVSSPKFLYENSNVIIK